jgi:PAS domain S-box-containing protein
MDDASRSSSEWAPLSVRPSHPLGLSESEAFLGRLLRHLPGMVYRCRNDPQWTMEFISQGCRELTGFDPSDLVKSRIVSYGDLIHPDDRDRVWDAVRTAADTGASFQVTYRLRRVDGRELRVWEQGAAVVDGRGRVESIEGFVCDVTDSHALIERAAEQEGHFRALVEQSLAGIYIIQGGRFHYVNRRLAHIFGYAVDELLAMESILDVVHPDDRDLIADNVRMRVEGELDEVRYEFRGMRKGGDGCDVEVHGRRIDLDGRPAVLGALLDITDRKRAERRYHEAQKMEALGRMATGVAHDLNNFLAVIQTTAQLVQAERPEDAPLTRDLDEILAAVGRGTALSQQLMDFGSTRAERGATTDVHSGVESLIPMLRRMLGRAVAIEADVEPNLPAIGMDPSRFEEVVTNLVVNAGQAMPEGGTVRIRARRDPVARRGARRRTEGSAAKGYAILEVEDEGVGISPELRGRLFEPYFTTKGDDGTGLGLANVWRLVGDVGGSVEVESSPGIGSTFAVHLPFAAETR